MPLGLLFQKALQFEPGLIETDGVDEILLLSRRGRRSPGPASSAEPAAPIRPLSA
jgi:hypothetical protein